MEENRRRSKTEMLRRYVVFGISLLVIALGISLITRSDLGTSPITSVPYVASLNTPVSLGVYFFLFTLVLIALQMLLLGKKGIMERKTELVMQFPVAFFLSVFTDLAMWLTSCYEPQVYYLKIISLILGCGVLALGICLEVIADVTMISAEYTIQFATLRFKKEFGTIKVCFDITLVVLAVLCSWWLSGRIEGVREGTIIAALITGPFVRFIMPHLVFVRRWLSMERGQIQEWHQETENTPLVITVSREYGSGGHQIGEMIARQMGMAFYDKELITLVAQESEFSEDFVSKNEQRMPSSLLYQMIMQDYEAPLNKSLSHEDALFVAQGRVIRRLAAEKPCVLVGRCANYILKNRPNTINVFLYADMEHKVERAVTQYGLLREQATARIEEIDNSRKEHFLHFTGLRWGDARNYTVSFDTGKIPMERVVETIKALSAPAGRTK